MHIFSQPAVLLVHECVRQGRWTSEWLWLGTDVCNCGAHQQQHCGSTSLKPGSLYVWRCVQRLPGPPAFCAVQPVRHDVGKGHTGCYVASSPLRLCAHWHPQVRSLPPVLCLAFHSPSASFFPALERREWGAVCTRQWSDSGQTVLRQCSRLVRADHRARVGDAEMRCLRCRGLSSKGSGAKRPPFRRLG